MNGADMNQLFEWRWVDDKGRGMTSWKGGANPPPVLDLRDSKGTMHVEVRLKSDYQCGDSK